MTDRERRPSTRGDGPFGPEPGETAPGSPEAVQRTEMGDRRA